VLLGAHVLLRVSKMIALEWQDIDLGTATLKIVSGTGGKTFHLLPSYPQSGNGIAPMSC
jgi:integrase